MTVVPSEFVGLTSPASRRSVVTSALGTMLAAATPGYSANLSMNGASKDFFNVNAIVATAQALAAAPFDAQVPDLPEELADLDYDAYRDVRFRKANAFLSEQGVFRLELMHRGFLFPRLVQINIVREGVVSRIPYSESLFDFGRTEIKSALSTQLGFAGLRLMYPLNSRDVGDELISFLGSSYFRFLSRGQQYGLSARALAVNIGLDLPEEFPFFREFWIEQPVIDATSITLHGLLDSPSVSGAYTFEVSPGEQTSVNVASRLFFRRDIQRLGVAPLTSMFLFGASDRRPPQDYRPQVHDSDGVLASSKQDVWTWRPLENPSRVTLPSILKSGLQGFGLIQRDRQFNDYQDLEAHYQNRPSYWVEPVGTWGPGDVSLLEIPSQSETMDNVGLFWTPAESVMSGGALTVSYRITAFADSDVLHSLGRVFRIFRTSTGAQADKGRPSRSGEARRLLIDFGGGRLADYAGIPSSVQIEVSAVDTQIINKTLMLNPAVGGFRAMIDLIPPTDATGDLSLALTAEGMRITEICIVPIYSE